MKTIHIYFNEEKLCECKKSKKETDFIVIGRANCEECKKKFIDLLVSLHLLYKGRRLCDCELNRKENRHGYNYVN